MKQLFFILAVLLTFGCYSPKKASYQVDKAHDKYPELVAKKTRDWFPCIPILSDTIDYVKSISDYKKLFGYYDSVIAADKHRADSLNDLLPIYISDTIKILADCNRITKENKGLKNTIANLQLAINNIKPIKIYFEDSAKIAVLRNLYDIQWIRAEKVEAKYEALHSRVKGKVLIPWWILVVVGAGVILSIAMKLKKYV